MTNSSFRWLTQGISRNYISEIDRNKSEQGRRRMNLKIQQSFEGNAVSNLFAWWNRKKFYVAAHDDVPVEDDDEYIKTAPRGGRKRIKANHSRNTSNKTKTKHRNKFRTKIMKKNSSNFTVEDNDRQGDENETLLEEVPKVKKDRQTRRSLLQKVENGGKSEKSEEGSSTAITMKKAGSKECGEKGKNKLYRTSRKEPQSPHGNKKKHQHHQQKTKSSFSMRSLTSESIQASLESIDSLVESQWDPEEDASHSTPVATNISQPMDFFVEHVRFLRVQTQPRNVEVVYHGTK